MNANKKTNRPISVKINDRERSVIEAAAKANGETISGYMRRVSVESAGYPFYTGKDVMQLLFSIGMDLAGLTAENQKEVISNLNQKGIKICQILSVR